MTNYFLMYLVLDVLLILCLKFKSFLTFEIGHLNSTKKDILNTRYFWKNFAGSEFPCLGTGKIKMLA